MQQILVRWIVFSFLALAFIQCTPKMAKVAKEQELSTPADPWTGLQRLIGDWHNSETHLFESWNANGQFSMKGTGYTRDAAKNHQLKESLGLSLATDGSISYNAMVFDENRGRAVKFKMTGHEKNSYTFENPEHDYPTFIKYTFLSADAFDATIGNKDKQQVMHYKGFKDEEE